MLPKADFVFKPPLGLLAEIDFIMFSTDMLLK